MKNNIIKIVLILLLLLLLGYGIYALFINKETGNVENNQNIESTQSEEEQDGTLTPEDVIKQLEGDASLEGDIEMNIISPEGETFQQGQARLWKAKLENIENDSSFGVNCHWKFYINENNEEVLYREMENRSGVSKEDPELCGFTSTFIDRVGKVRVVLEAEVVKSGDEIVNSFTAEREYTVF